MVRICTMAQARPQSQHTAPSEALAGTVERVTFHNAENGFCVLKVQARGKRDQVTVVGHSPAIGAGEWITASGAWISDRVHRGIADAIANQNLGNLSPDPDVRMPGMSGPELARVVQDRRPDIKIVLTSG